MIAQLVRHKEKEKFIKSKIMFFFIQLYVIPFVKMEALVFLLINVIVQAHNTRVLLALHVSPTSRFFIIKEFII